MSHSSATTQIISCFDSNWYLSRYPDVAEAGIDPLRHYLDHGRYEGRLPCDLDAARLDDELWFEGREEALAGLEQLAASPDDAPMDAAYAAWALARWYGGFENWTEVLRCMAMHKTSPAAKEIIPHPGPVLLELTALREIGDTEAARHKLDEHFSRLGEIPDLLLAAASVAEPQNRLEPINRLFRNAGLRSIGQADDNLAPGMDNLDATFTTKCSAWLNFFVSKVSPRTALVSVIVPACNAAGTLPGTLQSLRQQTWNKLEIILVDDASTDDTYRIGQQYASMDARIRIHRHEINQGVYAARNTGLADARGKYITVQDSDDWSHPQKIQRQVETLVGNQSLAACLSHWVRCTPDLKFRHWRMETSWIYPNTSSLMFCHTVRDRIGYWDRVKAGGDTEYYHRIRKAFGNDFVTMVMPGIPLAFGRHSPDSLSQSNATHLRTQYKGIRREYLKAAQQWHNEAAARGELYLPANPSRRPFPAPPELDDSEFVLQSGLFDPGWYIKTYPDVAEAGENPAVHYLLAGGQEGRDPGPHFSSSGYSYACPDAAFTGCNPLLHYLRKGKMQGYSPLPELPGTREQRAGSQTIMVCAHSSGNYLFGAERSLLDIVSALNTLEYNVVVTIPAAGNRAYMDELRSRSMMVIVIPYVWWSGERGACTATQAHFLEIIRKYAICAVHANTITLWEPLLAARECGIPTMVHARELPEHDPDLCHTLKSDPETIRRHVLALADHLIVNSTHVKNFFDVPEKTTIVPNTTDLAALDMDNPVGAGPIRIAMISSNTPKKGLPDFVRMATLLQDRAPGTECVLVGPENEHTLALLEGDGQNCLPDNIMITGYAGSPAEAQAQGNIIVNLSLCQESFGRIVLEAMAARRPVVAYDWGGLADLIDEGATGHLVPYRDVDAVVDRIVDLVREPERIIRMGEAGRRQAVTGYGPDVYIRNLKSVYSKVLAEFGMD